jgi:hypothetical protein
VTEERRCGTIALVGESMPAAARRLAAVTAAGALVGLVVGGLGGRLAMSALAALNPTAAGLTSDDGFVIGQVTLSGTLNLMLAGTMLGVLGAAIYTVLRPLMIGPAWFRLLSIGLGPAVVVGDRLVHVDGVDFAILDPVWLAIALFVLIPGVYAVALSLLAERWLAADGFFARATWPRALAPLVLFGPLVPVLVVLALGHLALDVVRRRSGGAVPGAAAAGWVARALLAVVFCLALASLAEKTSVLT